MPSKRKKADLKGGTDVFAEMLEKTTLDDRTTRLMIDAAKNGSASDISMIGRLFSRIPAAYVADAVTALCTVLNVPAFTPERPLPSSLSSSREKALHSLLALAQAPVSLLSDEQSSSLRIVEESWPTMCNWIQHIYHDLTASQPSKSSSPVKDSLLTAAAASVPSILSIFFCHEEALKRLTTKDDRLLNILIKSWLMPDRFLPNRHLLVGYHYQCYAFLHNCLAILDTFDTLDPSGKRLTTAVQNILHEAQGDAGVVTKKLLRQLRNPAKACSENIELVTFSLKISYLLVYERLEDDVTRNFMDSLLKDDLVTLTSHLLSFVCEDLANTPEHRVLSDDSSSQIIEYSLRLLLRSIHSRNGLHWLTVVFKLRFLHNVSLILSFDRCLKAIDGELLTMIFTIVIPPYLCHRNVVASAIKAVKEVTVNGGIAKIEAGALKEPWMEFTNILLERTVINTVFERDWLETEVRKCENCKKDRQETLLSKCAGCKTAMYCSRECQKMSWNIGGHRSHCMQAQELWYSTGMNMSRSALAFLNLIGVAELRRHMPGLSKHLASNKNPSGMPLGDAAFTISFTELSPTITVRSGTSLPNEPDDLEHDEALSRDAFREFQQTFSDGCIDPPATFDVSHYWGARKSVSSVQPMSPNIQLFAPGKTYPGNAKVDDSYFLHRKPAIDETGKNLAFVLDEVDRHVMDARKHFRPPAAGDEESPKTIYDYVETKVKADPYVLAWVKFKPS